MNKQFYKEADDVIVFVSLGPNTRNDYHVNPTEELFYQLKGDIAVRIRPLDGSKPHDVIIREGEMYLLPRHRSPSPSTTGEHHRLDRGIPQAPRDERRSYAGTAPTIPIWFTRPSFVCSTSTRICTK